MPLSEKAPLSIFVESFNADLAAIDSAARVSLPDAADHRDKLELRDDEGNFLAHIPLAMEPEMAALAYRLYGRGLNIGVRAGEETAWAKLRHLIGEQGMHAD